MFKQVKGLLWITEDNIKKEHVLCLPVDTTCHFVKQKKPQLDHQ